jgi:hypothetical protein
MSVLRRNVAGIRASARSFFREPFNLALLIALPALSIQTYGIGLEKFPDVGFLGKLGPLATTGRITGAVFAVGALAGVLGLFQLISAREADRRLSICGYPAADLLVSRFITLVAISLVIAGVGTGTLVALLSDPVGSILFTFVGLALAGFIYAMLGMLVGSVLPRELEGSLTLVILAEFDNLLASGIFQIKDGITQFSPLSYPHEIVTRAVIDGKFASGEVVPALAFVLVFGLLAVLAYTQAVETVETTAAGGES